MLPSITSLGFLELHGTNRISSILSFIIHGGQVIKGGSLGRDTLNISNDQWKHELISLGSNFLPIFNDFKLCKGNLQVPGKGYI
jgi:hypothetical protein